MNRGKGSETQKSPSRKPVVPPRVFVGVVWSMPSHEIADAVVREIIAQLTKDQITPGELIKAHEFYTTPEMKESHIVLVGLGTMFSARFVAACGIRIQRHDGSRLTESKKIQPLIDSTALAWRRDNREDQKRARMLKKKIQNGKI